MNFLIFIANEPKYGYLQYDIIEQANVVLLKTLSLTRADIVRSHLLAKFGHGCRTAGGWRGTKDAKNKQHFLYFFFYIYITVLYFKVLQLVGWTKLF